MKLFAEQLCDMAFAGCVFDHHHFAGTKRAALAIARGDLNPTLENNHILPAWRRMRLRKRLRKSSSGRLDKDNACRPQPFGRIAPRLLVSAFYFNFAEMGLTIGVGIQIKNTQ